MVYTNIRKFCFFFTLGLLLSVDVFSQVEDEQSVSDTSAYIPFFYKGALDYNLMIAASNGDVSEVNRLIANGADVLAETTEGATALILAISNNRTKVAKLLIDYGADINKITSKGDTPFFLAAKLGNTEITEALIRAGIDIDNTDRYDATALHYAAGYDYLDLSDMLLYYDISMEKKTVEGTTPLLAAVFAGSIDVADLLIQHGANIEASDNEGYTPFLMAAMNGDSIMMQLLYSKKADIYAVNKLSHNALDLSIISNNTGAVKYLLSIGKEWNKNDKGISPYTVASKYQRKDIVSILKKNNVPGNIKYNIDQIDITLSERFFLHDNYTGASFALREPFINGGVIAGIDTKLWYTRVLKKQSDNIIYQYRTKQTVIYAGLFKNFTLTTNSYKGNYELYTSLMAGYRFGNELKGTLYVPENKFMIIPATGVRWNLNDNSVSLGLEYMKSDFYKVSPVWLRLGFTYNLYFDRVRTKRKTLKWL